MKKIIRAAFMSATLCATFMASSVFAQVNLSVPLRTQEHSQWCWAGASQMVLQFKGKSVTQCAEANYALGINYACGNTTFNWNSQANQPNSTSAVTRILNWGGVSASTTGVISQSYSNQYLNASRPYIILWQWTSGGGHFVVVKGYSGNYLYINDPWPGNGSYTRTYASTVNASDRYWYDSARTN